MVNYVLMITAELENLTDFQPQGGCDDPNFNYYFKLKCGSCGEVSAKETCLSLNETVPLPSGKGNCNLVKKCKFCSREGTITMVTGRGKPLTQIQSEFGHSTPLMIEGTKFDDIDLSGGDFSEYDEKGECPVMISNLRATFSILK